MDFDDIKEGVVMVLVIGVLAVAMIAIIAAPIVGINSLVNSNKCDNLAASDILHEYKYTFWTGCRVRTSSGYWVLSDSPALVELELQQGE